MQVIDITGKINEKKQRNLDLEASCAIMEKSLKTLEFNNLPELKILKTIMKRTIKEMREKIENG